MVLIQCYIFQVIKKHEKLSTNLLIHIYINRINNRLIFKVKDGYKLELQTPEILVAKNVPSLEVF